ncbi:MAG TPA: hypothetical protein ENJ82_02180, partial [Bacteroidetes bacterium]|nr:hypothetical protein [Bacteroidota bacterium]
MSSFRIRPRFERIVSGSPEEVRKLFENALEKAEVPCTGRFIYDSITLYILEDEQHYWSPQLNMYLEEDPEGTQINGTYGPRPSVWAAFFYGYAIICLAALSIGMWGIALWMLEKDASILWG